MSEEKSSEYYFAVGIFKIDSFYAGFPDLEKIAQNWSKDENFFELIVRKVSDSNYGIQFLYFTKHFEKDVVETLKKELMDKFEGKKGVYAWDIQTSSGDLTELERIKRMIIKSRELKL